MRKKNFESHYLPLLLTLQIRQPNKKNSSLRWNTNSIRNWNPNNKIKMKKKMKKKEEEAKRFGLNLQKIQTKTKTHIQSKRENRSERKRGSEWEKERESIIAVDLQSLLPILISNPHRYERPTTKIQSKPKPTSNMRERIGVREREHWNKRKRENPPSPPLQTTTPSPPLHTTGSPWGSLSLGNPLSSSLFFFFG